MSLDHDHYIFPPEWVVNDNGTEIHQTKSTDPVLAVGMYRSFKQVRGKGETCMVY